MKSYEIECKYLIHTIPFDLKEYAFHDIEQGYLCTEPVVRIRKQDDRYLIPFGKYTIELDLFSSPRPDLMLAEVEFSSEEEALAFKAPDWFGEDVTSSSEYHNSTLSQS